MLKYASKVWYLNYFDSKFLFLKLLAAPSLRKRFVSTLTTASSSSPPVAVLLDKRPNFSTSAQDTEGRDYSMTILEEEVKRCRAQVKEQVSVPQ